MRKNVLLESAFLLMMGVSSLTATPKHDWENEQVIGINKESPHVITIPYSSTGDAYVDERSQSDNFRLLNAS